MKKIIACAGLNGNEKALDKLLAAIKQRKPDGVLFAGGIVAPHTHIAHKAEFMKKFFEVLGGSAPAVAIIPGPNDSPLREFYRAALNAEVVYPALMAVHATSFTRDDYAVCGIGGMLTESEDTDFPIIRYSHAAAEYYLRTLWQVEKTIKILLLSEPPPGQLGGSDGNPIAQEFITSYHPSICIVAGNKENRGSEMFAKTLVVNPGAIADGSAAWIERIAKKVEMLDL